MREKNNCTVGLVLVGGFGFPALGWALHFLPKKKKPKSNKPTSPRLINALRALLFLYTCINKPSGVIYIV